MTVINTTASGISGNHSAGEADGTALVLNGGTAVAAPSLSLGGGNAADDASMASAAAWQWLHRQSGLSGENHSVGGRSGQPAAGSVGSVPGITGGDATSGNGIAAGPPLSTMPMALNSALPVTSGDNNGAAPHPAASQGQVAVAGDAQTPMSPSAAAETADGGLSSEAFSMVVNGGITFDIGFDQAASSLPAGFVNAVSAAFQFYADTFSNPGVTLYYDVGFGEIDGDALEGGALGESENPGNELFSYNQVRAALIANATGAAAANAIANDLPATAPAGFSGGIDLAPAEAIALGLQSNSGYSFSQPVGWIGFTKTAPLDYDINPSDPVPGNQYSLLGVIEHEISEVMGRISDSTLMDLLRYSAPGNRQLGDGGPAYFSLDGGTTDLYNWNTNINGDLGDWIDANPYTPDSYNAFTDPGAFDPVTSRDIALMDVLGWHRVSGSTYTVGMGQSSAGLVIYSGDQEFVQAGGSSTHTYALSGAVEVVSAGGFDRGSTFSAGAQLFVDGGVVSAAIINDGVSATISGGTLEVTSVTATADILFAASSGTLGFATPQAFGGTISSLQAGDVIDFVSTTLTGAAINGSTLSVTVSGGQTYEYALADPAANLIPYIANDGSAGNELVMAGPAAPDVWLGGSDDWSNAADWSAAVPNSSSNVTVANTGIFTVTVAAGESESALAGTISAGGATLEVDGTLAVTVTLTVDAGTIVVSGTVDAADVVFSGTSERLVLAAGAVVSGNVAGGGNRLELATGTGTGTLSGLGTQITGFPKIALDSGTAWQLIGSNTIATGVTLSDHGTLTNAGTLDVAGYLIVDPATLINSGHVSGALTLGTGGYLENVLGGTIVTSGNAVYGGGSSTITNLGSIVAVGGGSTGIELAAGGTITNLGSIVAVGGGGIGIELAAGGTITNGNASTVTAVVSGGSGTVGSASATGGVGGLGVAGVTTLTNYGRIVGGIGGVGGYGQATDGGAGGVGGMGVGGAVALINSGSIVGGTGGTGGAARTGYRVVYTSGGAGGRGGAGAGSVTALTNTGLIVGGTGGEAGYIGSSGGRGGVGLDLVATLANTGTIAGGPGGEGDYYSGAGGTGVIVSAGGSILNSGLIGGGRGKDGVPFYGPPDARGGDGGAGGAAIVFSGSGTITNLGTIAGAQGGAGGGATGTAGTDGKMGDGIRLSGGGLVSNGSVGIGGGTALITGYTGVSVTTAAATVANYGTIIGSDNSGGIGADLALGGTILDAGLIVGSGGTALYFGGAGSNRLVLYPGYSIVGAIVMQGTANTLELGSNGAVGTLSGIGTGFTDFAAVTVDQGGLWMLGGHNTIASGIMLNSNATLTVGGTLTAAGPAVYGSGGTVVVTKNGFISGTGGDGVNLANGATVTNRGTIAGASNGATGVHLRGGGLVNNTATGVIQGDDEGVKIGGGGTLVNSGFISGGTGDGVDLAAGGTVVDAGTIVGNGGTAIYLGGTGGNLLALEQGYSLGGTVSLMGTGNTLELLGAAGPVSVDFDNGPGFTNFDTVLFGLPQGNSDVLTISRTHNLPGTVSGFTRYHDSIDLTQIDPTGAVVSFDTVSKKLTLSNSGGQSVKLQLDNEDYSSVGWIPTSDGSGGTDVAVACYCRGTLILTPTGEVPIETLAIGDRVTTLSGGCASIKWLGRRAYEPRFIAGNRVILPIRIAAGALCEGVPAHDLLISPDHALYLDGVLVMARLLLNGTTIAQAKQVDQLEYFHIELDSHDILMADGAPAESYVECDNRGMFHNAHEYARLYPDDQASGGKFCAPRLAEGASELPGIRALLTRRAAIVTERAA